MILGIIGLILNFIGSAGLVFYAYRNLGMQRTFYSPIPEKGRIKGFIRMEQQNDGTVKKVKRTKEEIKYAIFISLLSIGFFPKF